MNKIIGISFHHNIVCENEVCDECLKNITFGITNHRNVDALQPQSLKE